MYKELIQSFLLKRAAQKEETPIPPLHPIAALRAQGVGINPQILMTDPGRAVDLLMSRLKQRKIDYLQYKQAKAKEEEELQPMGIAARFAAAHQTNNTREKLSPISVFVQQFAKEHATPCPDGMNGEGKYVLSMNTKQDLMNPGNIGCIGRGTRSKAQFKNT